jgi:hypothetical protein
MSNLPTTQTKSVPSMLMDPQGFDQMYRVGKMLASSVLFPEHLRKGTPEQAAANGALVMNMAMRLNEDPLTVAQSIYFVGGKPGWSSSYMIGKANQHGVFKGPISWDVKGKGDSLSVTAFATLKDTGERVQATCDMEMARSEGWTKNAKYKSMPEQMLRYRSATFLIRLYCPEVMVGVPAQIEVELGGEMRDVTPREFTHAQPEEAPQQTQNEPDDAEIVSDAGGDEGPEPVDTARDTAPEKTNTVDEKADQVDGKPKASTAPDQEQFRALFEMIKRDLLDSPSVDEVVELYAPQIEQMQANAPGLHKELMDEIAAFKSEGGGK